MAMADTQEQDVVDVFAGGPVQALLVVDDDALHRFGIVVRHLCVGMIDEAVQLRVLSRSNSLVAGESIGPARVVNAPQGWTPWHRPDPEELLELLGGNRPQVMHCLSSMLARWARPFAAEWNSTLVVHLTDRRDVSDFRPLRSFARLKAIATTSVVQQVLSRRYPEMEARVSTVPLGIPGSDEPACLARPDRVPAALVMTPLKAGGGLEMVLKALHKVTQAGQELHLFVLGDGKGEPCFRRQLDRLDLRSRVTFAGAVNDPQALRNVMASADFFVLPRERRRFTVNTLIAMACGLAILAPRETVEDYLIDGRTARLFDSHAGDLADKWLSLLEDRSVARQLAHGAQDYVRAYHKASVMVCATAVLYRQVL